MIDQSEVGALAAESFGAWTMVRADKAWAQKCVPHEPTRRFLTEVGLPVQARLFDLSPEFHTTPLDIVEFLRRPPYPETLTPEFIASYGRLIYLAFFPELGAFLDPDTGRVYTFIGWDVAHLLNSSVADFLYFLAYVEKHRSVDGVLVGDLETAACYEAGAAITAHLTAVDAAAFEDQGGIWGGLLDDGFALGTFDDWKWNKASVAHFLRIGVNPTALEPRRPLGFRVADPWAAGQSAG